MSKELHQYRKFTQKSETDKSLHVLEGILKGINADRQINANEICELKEWCGLHYPQIGKPPYDEIIPLILSAAEDGIISSEEYENISWLCKNLTTDNKYYDVITADMQRLHGIMHGILADGNVTTDELRGLQDWINDHSNLMGIYPYDELEALIYKILEDKIIDEDEQKILRLFLSQFSELSESAYSVSGLEQIKKEIQLPTICTMNPNITFTGKYFCFTGISSKGDRSFIKGKIDDLGGIFEENITKKTNYLIIGDKNNPCWAFSCFGRKVEKAMEKRKSGEDIQIVKEIDFWDASIE